MAASLLLILTEFPPSFGGMQTHAVELCRYLHARGFRIEVATYREIRGPAAAPDFAFAVHRCLSRISYQANLRRLSELAAAANAELIYSSTVYFGELAQRTGLPVICRSAGNDVLRPWIAWPYELGSSLLDRPFFEKHLYHRLSRYSWPDRLETILLSGRQQVMRESARNMSRIFANSHFTQGLLSAHSIPGDRVSLLPGGVDAAALAPSGETKAALRAQLALRNDTHYLITACRLVPKKGLDTLLQALALLRRKDKQIQLLIAGEGAAGPSCVQWIKELGLDDAVTLLGYQPPARLQAYLQAADVFVLSSREITNPKNGLRDAETMGRVLCEANACGLPVVASRSGGIPSVILDGYNGLLAEESSPRDLAGQILRLRLNPCLAYELAANGLQRAKHVFDWKILFATHERVIEELTSARKSVGSNAREFHV